MREKERERLSHNFRYVIKLIYINLQLLCNNLTFSAKIVNTHVKYNCLCMYMMYPLPTKFLLHNYYLVLVPSIYKYNMRLKLCIKSISSTYFNKYFHQLQSKFQS